MLDPKNLEKTINQIFENNLSEKKKAFFADRDAFAS